jgi:glycosyltransferase involved in cell wall biosynthesis
MIDNNRKNLKIILFCKTLAAAGGVERVLLEEAKYFQKNNIVTYVLTLKFPRGALFNNNYDINIEQVGQALDSRKTISEYIQFFKNIHALRRRIKEIEPDLILATDATDCATLYLATLLYPRHLATHIHETSFWDNNNLAKYAVIYRKVFKEIRESVIGHQEFVPIKPPTSNVLTRIWHEASALLEYLGVRKAKRIFVLSNHMKWEVFKLYGKEAIVLKGAVSKQIFNYKPKNNFKEKLGLKGNMILNINRLDPRKRVDLLIKSFKLISDNYDDVILVIGGQGPDEKRLKELTKELKLSDKIIFIGYVKEEDLWDWLASCDVFVNPNWADFAIVAYEALALQKNVVWSTEMEVDDDLSKNRHLFVADPNVNAFAVAIERALNSEIAEINDLSMYAWDKYCERLLCELTS